MASDIDATNGHQPVVSTRSTSHVRAVDADVLDDAHVDDADAAIRAAGVVDVAQRVDAAPGESGGGVCHLLPVVVIGVDGDAEAGGRRGAGGIGRLARARRARPSRGRGSEPPRTARQPSRRRSATHSQTLPASCSAPRRAAPRGCAVTGAVQPAAGLRAGAAVGVEDVAPRPRRGRRRPRASASHSSPGGRRTRGPCAPAAQAQKASASAKVMSVAGWSASCGSASLASSSGTGRGRVVGEGRAAARWPRASGPSSTAAQRARDAPRRARRRR